MHLMLNLASHTIIKEMAEHESTRRKLILLIHAMYTFFARALLQSLYIFLE